MKWLLLFAAIGVAAYFILGKKQISGTVTIGYSGAKVSTPAPASPGDSAGNALIGPSTYTY